MVDDDRTVRSAAWDQLLPWTLIFRTFGLSLSPAVLLLALVGAWITPLGWRLADTAFLDPARPRSSDMNAVREQMGRFPSDLRGPQVATEDFGDSALAVTDRVLLLFRAVLHHLDEWQQAAYLTSGALWTIAVWALFGGAITRIAVVRLGRQQREGLFGGLRFAARRFFSYCGAPLSPLVGVAFAAGLQVVIGLTMRVDAVANVWGALWILLLLGNILVVLFLVVLAAGWPLMWCVVSTEEDGDAFDALSRSFAYVYQRPFRLLCYVGLAIAIGCLGWILLDWIVDIARGLALQFTGWGLGRTLIVDSREPAFAVRAMEFWGTVFESLVACYRYAYLWTAAAAIYLIRRYDVDRTEFDEVYMPDELYQRPLPQLERDAAGVPGVASTEPGSQRSLAGNQPADADGQPAGESDRGEE